MKKKILSVSFAVAGAGALAFFLIRAERTILRQQQYLNGLSAQVVNLRAQLDDVQKRSGLYFPGRTVQNGGVVKNPIFKEMPNAGIMPYSPASPEAPPGWIPFRFNGMTYYRIPLASR
jgi:hypothetical protein